MSRLVARHPACTAVLSRAFLFTALLLAFAACSGGGSSTGSEAPPGGDEAQPAPNGSAVRAESFASFIPDSFVLFWPGPVRAYPGVPLDFRFNYYDALNQGLRWELSNAPAGMTISQRGEVAWTADTAGAYPLSVRVTRADGRSIERTLTIRVDPDDFFFVSPDGSDENPGSHALPFRTIRHAIASVPSGDGKTVYLRGGVYEERYHWEVDGVISPFTAKRFTPDDPLEIRSLPGEHAILDCGGDGHGLWAFETSYVLIDNIEVRNAGAGERGGLMAMGDHIVISDTIVHGSRWSSTDNVTGYYLNGSDLVFDRNVGYDNRDPSSDSWNSSNWIVYADSGEGTNHILNSKSFGSVVGFKVKHAGPRRVIIHNCESFDADYGYAVASAGSSVRHSIAYNVQNGILVGIADPNGATDGPVLVANNTVVNASGAGVVFQTGYARNGSVIEGNVIYGPAGAASLHLWADDPDAAGNDVRSDQNVFFSAVLQVVRVGPESVSLADWQARGHDSASKFIDPMFVSVGEANLSVPEESPVTLEHGPYAGAFVPGGRYPRVGVPSSAPAATASY